MNQSSLQSNYTIPHFQTEIFRYDVIVDANGRGGRNSGSMTVLAVTIEDAVDIDCITKHIGC